jgi:hypothetical protein
MCDGGTVSSVYNRETKNQPPLKWKTTKRPVRMPHRYSLVLTTESFVLLSSSLGPFPFLPSTETATMAPSFLLSQSLCSLYSSTYNTCSSILASRVEAGRTHIIRQQKPEPDFLKTFKVPKNRFQGTNSASLCGPLVCVAWRAGTTTLFLLGS